MKETPLKKYHTLCLYGKSFNGVIHEAEFRPPRNYPLDKLKFRVHRPVRNFSNLAALIEAAVSQRIARPLMDVEVKST